MTVSVNTEYHNKITCERVDAKRVILVAGCDCSHVHLIKLSRTCSCSQNRIRFVELIKSQHQSHLNLVLYLFGLLLLVTSSDPKILVITGSSNVRFACWTDLFSPGSSVETGITFLRLEFRNLFLKT